MGNQPLSALSKRLSQHIGRPAPNYRRLWLAAASGEIPMLEQRSGRWFFEEADIAKIARALGLEAAPDKRRKAAA